MITNLPTTVANVANSEITGVGYTWNQIETTWADTLYTWNTVQLQTPPAGTAITNIKIS